MASLNSIKSRSTWCPRCPLKNESECLRLFETLLGVSFPKCRPDWLEGLELDGYNEEMGLAFEYNGEQHYKVIPHWHPKGEESLKEQQERDQRKAALCTEHDVTLIVIPYWVKNKRDFIWRELTLLGYDIVPGEDYSLVDDELEESAEAPEDMTASDDKSTEQKEVSPVIPEKKEQELTLTNDELVTALEELLGEMLAAEPPPAPTLTDAEVDELMAELTTMLG